MNIRLINETDNFVRLKDIEDKFYRLPLKSSDYFKLLEYFGYIVKTDIGFVPTEKSVAIGCDHHQEGLDNGYVYSEYVTWSIMIYTVVERLITEIRK